MSKDSIFDINFTLYLLGRLVSNTGTSVQIMILPLYIIDIGGSASTVGIFTFLSLFPALLVYPFAGVLGDRMNRKIIMLLTDFVSAIVILNLALLSYLDRMNLSILLIAQIIISILNGLFDPATRGMLPQLITKDKLAQGNSFVTSLKSLSFLLGPIIGAILYAKFGIRMVFLVNGISFVISGFSEMMIRYSYIKVKKTAGLAGIANELVDGIKFILENKIIRYLCYYFMAIYLFVQPIFRVILPLLFKKEFTFPDTYYGYLQAIFVLGVFFGSIIVSTVFGKRENNIISFKVGSILLMIVMFLFAIILFPNIIAELGNDSIIYFIVLAIVLCLLSASITIISIPIQTKIQKETPNEYMSRVLSLVTMISKAGIPFGGIIYGFILDRIAVYWFLFGIAILITFISSIFLRLFIRLYDH